tara:strand:- start:154 stop:1170 length:1017 start_codon:yes stop_codon:yes gene_type:complete
MNDINEIKKNIEFYQTRILTIGVPSIEQAQKGEDVVNLQFSRGWTPPIINDVPLFSSIQIQTIEYCNLRCDFCPNHYMIWDRKDDKKKGIPFNTMSLEDYEKICINLKKLGFWGRVSPYLMNEPLMDKDRMPKFIEITKKHLPDCNVKINTNGSGLTAQLMGDMIDAGLDSIQIDDYFSDDYAQKLINELKPFHGENGKCYIILSSNYNTKQVKKRQDSIEGDRPVHYGPAGYWNRAGLVNVNPDMPVPQKNCGYPSTQMYVKWDGSSLLCCCDWEYKVVHGNVLKTSIEEVWTNDSYQHYRKTLKKGRRDLLKMCRKCNKGAYPNEEERLKNFKMEQ